MLEVTAGAAAVLDDTRTKNGLPDDVAVRISPGGSDNGRAQAAGYELRFATKPQDGDVVLDSGSTRVFVAPEVAEPLGAAVLDAEQTAEGPKLVLKRNAR